MNFVWFVSGYFWGKTHLIKNSKNRLFGPGSSIRLSHCKPWVQTSKTVFWDGNKISICGQRRFQAKFGKIWVECLESFSNGDDMKVPDKKTWTPLKILNLVHRCFRYKNSKNEKNAIFSKIDHFLKIYISETARSIEQKFLHKVDEGQAFRMASMDFRCRPPTRTKKSTWNFQTAKSALDVSIFAPFFSLFRKTFEFFSKRYISFSRAFAFLGSKNEKIVKFSFFWKYSFCMFYLSSKCLNQNLGINTFPTVYETCIYKSLFHYILIIQKLQKGGEFFFWRAIIIF